MVARQESSALLGCRKKVFENARQMWFLPSYSLLMDKISCLHLPDATFGISGCKLGVPFVAVNLQKIYTL